MITKYVTSFSALKDFNGIYMQGLHRICVSKVLECVCLLANVQTKPNFGMKCTGEGKQQRAKS